MHKFKKALSELTGNTSERTAVIGAILVKAGCLIPVLCAGLHYGASFLDTTPDGLVGGLLGYVALRFSSKLQKAQK